MIKKKNGDWEQRKVNYVEFDDESEAEEDRYDYDFRRVIYKVSRLGDAQDSAHIQITPTENASYRTKVPWTVDLGVKKTLLSEKHFTWILDKNPEVKLKHTRVRFKPYSTDETVPLLGCCDVRLTNNKGKAV